MLVKLARSGTESQQSNAAGALACLAEGSEGNRQAVVLEGAVDALVTLARSGTEG